MSDTPARQVPPRVIIALAVVAVTYFLYIGLLIKGIPLITEERDLYLALSLVCFAVFFGRTQKEGLVTVISEIFFFGGIVVLMQSIAQPSEHTMLAFLGTYAKWYQLAASIIAILVGFFGVAIADQNQLEGR